MPNSAASETMAPTGAWTGAFGFSRLRYRASGLTENAAKTHAGTATEPANTNADNGSATTASTAIAIAAAIAPAVESPAKGRDHDRQWREIRERHRQKAGLSAHGEQQRGGASGPDGDDKAMQHDERCPALACG